MGKRVVAYFSATGTTEKVAKAMASALKADLHPIKPAVPYSQADLNWNDPKSRSSIEMRDMQSRPPIANTLDDFASYDLIFLGFPIWWYVAPAIIRTFLEEYDFSGKTIVLFATSGGSGFGKTVEDIKKYVSGTATIREGKIFTGSAQEREALAWIEEFKQETG